MKKFFIACIVLLLALAVWSDTVNVNSIDFVLSRRNRSVFTGKTIVIDLYYVYRFYAIILALVSSPTCKVTDLTGFIMSFWFGGFMGYARSPTDFSFYTIAPECSKDELQKLLEKVNRKIDPEDPDWWGPIFPFQGLSVQNVLYEHGINLHDAELQFFDTLEANNMNLKRTIEELQFGGIEVVNAPVDVEALDVSTVAEDYPAKCVNNLSVKCYGDDPECGLPCPAGATCKPEEADKYCTPEQGCVKEVAMGGETGKYVCGSFSSASMMTIAGTAVLVVVAAVFSVM